MSNPPCDLDLYANGATVGFYETRDGSAAFESRICEIREAIGAPVDWHYSAGRARVVCWPDQVAAVRELLPGGFLP